MPLSELKDRAVALIARALIGLALILPYALRVKFFGWLVAKVAAPIAGWKRRVIWNLSLVIPDLARVEALRIADQVCNNVGRTLIEIYSGEEFLRHIENTPFEGPGAALLKEAISAERPVIPITAHMGNYDVIRGALAQRGLKIGAPYRPMTNKAFNARYVEAISTIGRPVFPLGRAGVKALVNHLKGGGSLGIIADVGNFNGPLLSFFNKPAYTPVSAADWATKFDVPLIPIFALREPDGLHFRVHVAEPFPHGRPENMMQAFNNLVEELVRENLDQWFWIHQRWKLSPAAQTELIASAKPLQAMKTDGLP